MEKLKHTPHRRRRAFIAALFIGLGLLLLAANILVQPTRRELTVSNLGETIGETVGQVGEDIGTAAGEAGQSIGEAAGSLGESIGETMGDFGRSVGEMFSGQSEGPGVKSLWPL